MTDLEALKVYAAEYVSAKEQEKQIKKRVDNANSVIKDFMKKLNLDTVELEDGSVVCYDIRTRESVDEDKLLIKLKEFAPDTQSIKTKEYVDMDILESELYHDKLPKEALTAMDECRIVKEIPTLTIKKGK